MPPGASVNPWQLWLAPNSPDGGAPPKMLIGPNGAVLRFVTTADNGPPVAPTTTSPKSIADGTTDSVEGTRVVVVDDVVQGRPRADTPQPLRAMEKLSPSSCDAVGENQNELTSANGPDPEGVNVYETVHVPPGGSVFP